MGTPLSAWGSGLGGARRPAPMVLVPAFWCAWRMVRGCGSGCQRRKLGTKWLCPTRRIARGMLIAQEMRCPSFVALWVGAGTYDIISLIKNVAHVANS